jgi:hypothetical protein
MTGHRVRPQLIVQLARCLGDHSEAAKTLNELSERAQAGVKFDFFLVPESSRVILARRWTT